MKKIKIGIPRAFLYYQNNILWKVFFEKINCKVIISPDTNDEILNIGTNCTVKECCLSYKIYFGHALYLSNICDYILIPKAYNYGKNNNICPLFNTILDDLERYISKSQILTYNIDYVNFKFEFNELFKIGLKFTKNPIKIIYSYIIAKRKQKNYDINKQNEQKNKLLKEGPKVLIISKYYNIEDNYIKNKLIPYLDNNNIISLYSNNLNKKTAMLFSHYFSNNLSLKNEKQSMGSLYYYKYQIDGIIFISVSNCQIEQIINNIAIYQNKNIPFLKYIINETDQNKKLLDFINIVKYVYSKK